MADLSYVLPLVLLLIATLIHFCLHRVDEGHVAVYYRVNIFFKLLINLLIIIFLW